MRRKRRRNETERKEGKKKRKKGTLRSLRSLRAPFFFLNSYIPERVHVARLVLARQPLLVARPVLRDVLRVRLRQLLDRGLDRLHAAVLAHRLGREVGVRARAVPVALDRLGGEGADDAHVLAEAVEEPAGDHDLEFFFFLVGEKKKEIEKSEFFLTFSGRKKKLEKKNSKKNSEKIQLTWSPTSSGPTGPIWNSHWPGMTSALMPEMMRPALMHASCVFFFFQLSRVWKGRGVREKSPIFFSLSLSPFFNPTSRSDKDSGFPPLSSPFFFFFSPCAPRRGACRRPTSTPRRSRRAPGARGSPPGASRRRCPSWSAWCTPARSRRAGPRRRPVSFVVLSFRCCIIERDKEGKRVRKKRAKNDEEKVEKTRKKKLEKKKKKKLFQVRRRLRLWHPHVGALGRVQRLRRRPDRHGLLPRGHRRGEARSAARAAGGLGRRGSFTWWWWFSWRRG